jgi:hypothetical protein
MAGLLPQAFAPECRAAFADAIGSVPWAGFTPRTRRLEMIDTLRRTFVRCAAVSAVALSFSVMLPAQTAAATSAPAVAPAPEWKTYSYPEDGFSAVYPNAPELQKSNVPTDAGTFELRAYLAMDGEAAVFVGVCDYGSAVAGRSSDTVLEGAQGGAVSNTKSHLISTKRITLGTYPGITFEAENDSMHFSARIYLVGTTLYQTLTAAPLGKPYRDTTRFFDSFQLIARVKN